MSCASTTYPCRLPGISRSLAMFFFSSRRRHTRFDCDWSSDVCSSDLHVSTQPMRHQTHAFLSVLIAPLLLAFTATAAPSAQAPGKPNILFLFADDWRSEERRVGKE